MDAACRQAILDNHRWMQEWADKRSTPPCIFGNILEQVPPGSFSESDEFSERAKKIQKAWLQQSQSCNTHNKACCCTYPVDFDMSGLPCQDNSAANTKRKYFQQGKYGSVYLVWAKKAQATTHTAAHFRKYPRHLPAKLKDKSSDMIVYHVHILHSLGCPASKWMFPKIRVPPNPPI